jgi:hypothetical protein
MLSNTNNVGNTVPAGNQLPISKPFNSEAPSSLSTERIKEINALCLNAYPKGSKPTLDSVEHYHLMSEIYHLQEVFEELTDLNTNEHTFFYVVNSAFESLILSKPNDTKEIFNVYKELTNMFRVFGRNHDVIDSKLDEINILCKDVELLETESFNHSKGGSNNA